jgi:hypothetical protein
MPDNPALTILKPHLALLFVGLLPLLGGPFVGAFPLDMPVLVAVIVDALFEAHTWTLT